MFDLKDRLISGKDCFPDILGQDATKRQLKSALLTGRHLIIVGPPGIGKTTLAKNVAQLLPTIEVNDCGFNCLPNNPVCPECLAGKKVKTTTVPGSKRFIRIQGSPDLTSEDLLGDIDPVKALKFGPISLDAFTPGKIFKANNGVLFFDELNRCPEKLQNALLQVLEERKATLGSYEVDFAADFIFIGTMNPRDSSTEKLSDVFIDRFDLIYMDYPESLEIESEIVKKKGRQLAKFPEQLLSQMVDFVRSLRENKKLERYPSVRASIGLYERSQANALLSQRDTVTLEDIQEAVISVLSHRIKLKPSFRYLMDNHTLIREEFERFLEGTSDKKGGGR